MAFSSKMSTMLCGVALVLVALLLVFVLLKPGLLRLERFDAPPSDIELNIAIVKAYNDTLRRFPTTEELTSALNWTKSTLPATTLSNATLLAVALADFVKPVVSATVPSVASPAASASAAQPAFSPVNFAQANTDAAPQANNVPAETILDLKRQIDGLYATIQKIEQR